MSLSTVRIITGGVVASIASLALTLAFGGPIVTVVVTGSVAVAGCVVGVGALAVTGRENKSTGNQYERIADAFCDISKQFDHMKEIASTADQAMLKFMELVEEMKFDQQNASDTVNLDKDFDSFKATFNILLEHIAKVRRNFGSYRKNFEDDMKKLENIH